MAKKKTVSAKKPTSAKKKPTSAKKKVTSAKKKPAVAKKKTTVSTKKPMSPKNAASISSAVIPDSGTHQQNIQLLPPTLISDTIESLNSLMADFKDVADNNLTSLQRRRKIGAGIKNYGFIDKVSDLATANPQYAQFFKITDLKNSIRNIEDCREIVILLQAFARLVSNTMLIYSDDAYSMALIYYNMVKEMSRRGDPEAMEIFNVLRPFFRRPRRSSEEPTVKELERDLHALIHGKKDGKIVVEGVAAKKTGGARKVIDDVHKSTGMIKESAEEQFDN